MSNEYINTEVDKIINEEKIAFPKSIAMASAWICGNLKGINLRVMDVSKTSSLSDYFILASATNITQSTAMANEIVNQMTRLGHPPRSKEGLNGSDWILLDIGDILIHIFLDSSRDVYALDNLWKEAAPVAIPQHYYFSADDSENPAIETETSYF